MMAFAVAALIVTMPYELQMLGSDNNKAVNNAAVIDDGSHIQAVALNVGTDETEINFTWYDDTGEDGTVYVAEKTDDASLLDDDGFPKEVQFTAEADREPVRYTSGNSSNYASYTINKATVSGLKPGTEYVYRVGNGDTYSPAYDYESKGTIPKWSFYYACDPQLNNPYGQKNDVVERWESTVDKIRDVNPDSSLMVVGGDLAHDGGGNEYQYIHGFLEPEGLRNLAIGTTVGNHDQHTSGIPFDEHFNHPNQTDIGSYVNTPGDYWYTYNNALFVHLTMSVRNDVNSALKYVDQHVDFIREAIEANPDTDWHIIVFHEALFSAGWHATEESTRTMRNTLIPLLDDIDYEYGIDLVLNAHEHHYSRSYLMHGTSADLDTKGQNEFTDPDGIFYVTGNTASGVLYNDTVKIDYDYLDFMEQQYTPNISNIDITTDPYETTLHMTTYRTAEDSRYTGTEGSMTVVDELTIHKNSDAKYMGSEKNISNDEYGVTVFSVPNVFSQDQVSIDVKPVTTGNEYNTLQSALENDPLFTGANINSSALDVKTDWCGNDMTFREAADVFIKFPEGLGASADKPYAVYTLDDSGKAVKIAAQLMNKDGKLGVTFKTSKTGTYALGVKGAAKTEPDDTGKTTVTPNDGQKPETPAAKLVRKLSVSKKKITLKAKAKYTLKVKVKPADASNKKLKYKTSNKKVAKVSAKGKITAVKPGKATITVKAADGSKKSLKIKVVVKAKGK